MKLGTSNTRQIIKKKKIEKKFYNNKNGLHIVKSRGP